MLFLQENCHLSINSVISQRILTWYSSQVTIYHVEMSFMTARKIDFKSTGQSFTRGAIFFDVAFDFLVTFCCWATQVIQQIDKKIKTSGVLPYCCPSHSSRHLVTLGMLQNRQLSGSWWWEWCSKEVMYCLAKVSHLWCHKNKHFWADFTNFLLFIHAALASAMVSL